jgi:hypothetical protein
VADHPGEAGLTREGFPDLSGIGGSGLGGALAGRGIKNAAGHIDQKRRLAPAGRESLNIAALGSEAGHEQGEVIDF